ncbi:MAG: hypothetical protein AB1555_13165 [Nitrospirota bacterium]
MLHRLALRVLPSLTLTVTEDEVRKRKRRAMLLPGLVAFGVYRALKPVVPLDDPLVVLGVSGFISTVTAAWAYRVGRGGSTARAWREDGVRQTAWLLGWVGFVYGIQLSLLVLALLRVMVGYDFFAHPDGPAMMAIVIACTSVARDAFEIGYVRRQERSGRPFPTFPDGMQLRSLIRDHTARVGWWTATGAFACAGLALAGAGVVGMEQVLLWQLVLVTTGAGSLAVFAYFGGQQRHGGWLRPLSEMAWSELFKFWWWPGLAFAATYYLSLVGAAIYLLRLETIARPTLGLMAGGVGGLMSLYGYYLGHRRSVEDRLAQTVPASLLRCPFVIGILSKSTRPREAMNLQPANTGPGESGGRPPGS